MVSRVWGGRRLADEFEREISSEEPIGESWEIHGELTVAGTDTTLDQLVCDYGQSLLGSKVDGSAGFPLLTKWLDCKAWLSVQVHPDDALAREFTKEPKARGKTEAWYVHRVYDEAELIHDLKDGVTAEQLSAAKGEQVLPLLARFKPRQGQLLFTPAGVIHALGPGNLIYEVQQSCDITYRIYDWGRDREIHPELSIECAKRARRTPSEVKPDSLSCEFFEMALIEGPHRWEVTAESFQIVATTEDSTLRWSDGTVLLKAGQSVLLPAGLGSVELDGHFLKVGIP